MKDMETKFTEKESLEIISKMISQARNNLQKGSGNSMIFIGLLVAILSILNVILALVFIKNGIRTQHSFWIWCLIIPGTYINSLIKKKVEQKSMVKTHIDSIIKSIWKGYAYSCFVFLVVIFSIGFGKNFYHVFYLINPVILTLVGLAEFVTAKVCRFKPYMYGAFVMWLGALACAAVMISTEPVIVQFFILSACMILGFVIPGYKLNKTAEQNV
jgi:hypothetical protein